MQLPPELLCRVPTQVHTCLQQWRLTGYRQPGVDKDFGIPGPALLVPVEPLDFLGGWVLDEALTSHGSILVHTYQAIAGHIKTPVGYVQAFGQTMSNQRLKASPAVEALSFQQTPERHLADHTFGLRRALWSTNPTRSVGRL